MTLGTAINLTGIGLLAIGAAVHYGRRWYRRSKRQRWDALLTPHERTVLGAFEKEMTGVWPSDNRIREFARGNQGHRGRGAP